ncbi:hypothetical protein [Aquicella siphonis]|nr:hypothetical protein [Aquicella siphonis]
MTDERFRIVIFMRYLPAPYAARNTPFTTFSDIVFEKTGGVGFAFAVPQPVFIRPRHMRNICVS